MRENKKKISMKGGDGYAVNVLQPIAGRPSYIRYTDNCKPVFQGSLLQNGGSKMEVNVGWTDPTDINNQGQMSSKINQIQNTDTNIVGYNTNVYEKFMVLDSSNGNNTLIGGGNKKNCGCDKKEDSIFHLLKQKGGFVTAETSQLGQFIPIQQIAQSLSPLSVPILTSLVIVIFLYYYMKKKNKKGKGKMMGGKVSSLETVLQNLGKNNLLVLSSILLLHHYAKQKLHKKNRKGGFKGGYSILPILQKLLKPLSENEGEKKNSLLMKISKSFKNKKGGYKNEMEKNIRELGAKKFLAKGIFTSLDKLFSSKIRYDRNNKKSNQMKVSTHFHELFDMISPVTFSTFANKMSIKKAQKIKNMILQKNNKK